MKTHERSLNIVVTRIMKDDARGRPEANPRLLRAIRRLRHMSPATAGLATSGTRQCALEGASNSPGDQDAVVLSSHPMASRRGEDQSDGGSEEAITDL
jgi:hypothetical protein